MTSINDTDKELLLLAAETIRLHCRECTCSDCLFYVDELYACELNYKTPLNWRLKSDKDC